MIFSTANEKYRKEKELFDYHQRMMEKNEYEYYKQANEEFRRKTQKIRTPLSLVGGSLSTTLFSARQKALSKIASGEELGRIESLVGNDVVGNIIDNPIFGSLYGVSKGFGRRQKIQEDKALANQLGAIGKASRLSRSYSQLSTLFALPKMIGMATGAGTLGLKGLTSTLTGGSMPAILAMTAARAGIGLLKAQKKAKLIAKRTPASKIEKARSVSNIYRTQLRVLMSHGQAQSIDVLKVSILSTIADRVGPISEIYAELEYLKKQKEKNIKTFSSDYEKKTELEGETGVNRFLDFIEGSLGKAIAKYNPFQQLVDFLVEGKTPKQVQDELAKQYGFKSYAKLIEKKAEKMGITIAATQLLTMTSSQLIGTAQGYESKLIALNSGMYDLMRFQIQEIMTLRKVGYGISDVLSMEYEDKKEEYKGFLKGIIGAVDNFINNIPVLSSIVNLVKLPFQTVSKVKSGIDFVLSGIKHFFLDELADEDYKASILKSLGYDKSDEQKSTEFIAYGLPVVTASLISLSERKIEILTDILKVSSDQYRLFSGNVFKQTESKVENRVWDEIERKFVSPKEYERNREMEKATLHSELLKTYEHTLSYFVRKTGSNFLRFFDRNRQEFSASQTLEKLIGDESEVFKEIEEKRKASQPMDIILGNSISQPDQTQVPTISNVIVDSTEILRRSAESIRFGLDFKLDQILQTIISSNQILQTIRDSIPSVNIEKVIVDSTEILRRSSESIRFGLDFKLDQILQTIISSNQILQTIRDSIPSVNIEKVIVDSTEILRRSSESIRFGLDFKLDQILQTIRELSPSIRESIDQINFRNVVFINEWKRRHSDDYYNDDEINVSHLASGGIVSKPTLSVIGENEPEAVIPLNKLLLNEDRSVKDELKEVEEEKIKKEEKSYRSSSLNILQKIFKELQKNTKLNTSETDKKEEFGSFFKGLFSNIKGLFSNAKGLFLKFIPLIIPFFKPIFTKIKDIASEAVLKGKDIASKVVSKGKDIAVEIVSKGKDIAVEIASKGKDIASKVILKGKDIASKVILKGKDIAVEIASKGKDIASKVILKGKDFIANFSQEKMMIKIKEIYTTLQEQAVTVKNVISSTLGNIATSIKTSLTTLSEKLVSIGSEAGEMAIKVKKATINLIAKGKEILSKTISKAKEGIIEKGTKVLSKVKSWGSTVWEGTSKVASKAGSLLKSGGKTVWKGVKTVGETVSNIAGKIKGPITKVLSSGVGKTVEKIVSSVGRISSKVLEKIAAPLTILEAAVGLIRDINNPIRLQERLKEYESKGILGKVFMLLSPYNLGSIIGTKINAMLPDVGGRIYDILHPKETNSGNLNKQNKKLPTTKELNELGISGYASGGIVSKPTLALVGEQHKSEVIAPLENVMMNTMDIIKNLDINFNDLKTKNVENNEIILNGFKEIITSNFDRLLNKDEKAIIVPTPPPPQTPVIMQPKEVPSKYEQQNKIDDQLDMLINKIFSNSVELFEQSVFQYVVLN